MSDPVMEKFGVPVWELCGPTGMLCESILEAMRKQSDSFGDRHIGVLYLPMGFFSHAREAGGPDGMTPVCMTVCVQIGSTSQDVESLKQEVLKSYVDMTNQHVLLMEEDHTN